jgi:hypothetical protein
MVNVAAVLAASASLLNSEMVTTFAVTLTSPLGTVVGSPVNPPVKSTVGLVMVNAGLNVTKISLPGLRAPLEVNLTVQVVAVAPAAIEDPEKLTDDTVAAATGRASRVAPRPPASKPSTRPIGKSLFARLVIAFSVLCRTLPPSNQARTLFDAVARAVAIAQLLRTVRKAALTVRTSGLGGRCGMPLDNLKAP